MQPAAGAPALSQPSISRAAGTHARNAALHPSPSPLPASVAFVLLEDFEQADPRGITDGLDAGVQEGQ